MKMNIITESPIIEIQADRDSLILYHSDLADAKVGDTWCCRSHEESETTLKVVYCDETGLALLEQEIYLTGESVATDLHWVSLHRKRGLEQGQHRRRPPQK